MGEEEVEKYFQSPDEGMPILTTTKELAGIS
jgi:hypothetical protein